MVITLPSTATRKPRPGNGSPAVYFFERSYPHDDILSPALFRLRASLAHRRDDQGWLREQLHDLLQRLLAETDRSVTEIGLAVGFESLGSFSWLFKRRFGVSPEGYRLQVCVAKR